MIITTERENQTINEKNYKYTEKERKENKENKRKDN